MAEKISFKFLGDARDLINTTRGANRALESTEDQSSRTDRAMGRMDETIRGLAIGVGAAQLGKFALDAIAMGDAAEQLADSARTVLGPELDALHDNLEDVRGAMGLNISEIDGLAAQYGLLTDGMGLTDEAQREFIETLILVGGDLAAFNGRVEDVDAAIESLGGAVKGEFDSLEQWGVKINAAAVEARFLELRADDANSAISDQELRLQALTDLIEQQAAPALGALAEAEETNAVKANRLKTKWEDLQILLGQFLSPALEWLLDLVLNASEAWQRLTDKQEFWNTRLGSWVKAIQNFTDDVLEPFRVVVREIGEAFDWLRGRVQAVVDALKRIKFPSVPSWVPGIGGSDGPPKSVPGLTGGTAKNEAVGPVGFNSAPAVGGIHITVNAGVGDPQAIGRAIVEVLQQYEQTNGAIPITVAQSET